MRRCLTVSRGRRASFDMAAVISSPPSRLLKPMTKFRADRLVLGAGPGNMSPRVLAACSLPQLSASPVEPQIVELMADIRDGIRYVFQTTTQYTLCISGPGNAGLEASCSNILEPGEVLLSAAAGFWGRRICTFAERYGIDFRCICKPNGSVFSLSEIEQALVEHKPRAMYIAYGESSAGTVQPIEHLGSLCHKYDCLLIVDAISAAGAVPLFMDKWEIDVLFTGAQKVLGALTGVTPVALNEAAWLKVKNRTKPVTPYYFDFTLLASMWGCFGERRYIHSPFNTNIYTLREALAELVEEGLENSWARHKHCTELLHRGLAELGFTFVADDPSYRLPAVTAVRIPADIKSGLLLRDILNERFNILVSPGLYPPEESDSTIRIGIMGYNARPQVVETLLTSLAAALQVVRQESGSTTVADI